VIEYVNKEDTRISGPWSIGAAPKALFKKMTMEEINTITEE